MYMKENLKTVNFMEKENTALLMELNIKVNFFKENFVIKGQPKIKILNFKGLQKWLKNCYQYLVSLIINNVKIIMCYLSMILVVRDKVKIDVSIMVNTIIT